MANATVIVESNRGKMLSDQYWSDGGVGMRSGQRVILRCKRRDSRKAAALLLNTTGT